MTRSILNMILIPTALTVGYLSTKYMLAVLPILFGI